MIKLTVTSPFSMSGTATLGLGRVELLSSYLVISISYIHVSLSAFVYGSIPSTFDSFHWQTEMAIR